MSAAILVFAVVLGGAPDGAPAGEVVAAQAAATVAGGTMCSETFQVTPIGAPVVVESAPVSRTLPAAPPPTVGPFGLTMLIPAVAALLPPPPRRAVRARVAERASGGAAAAPEWRPD